MKAFNKFIESKTEPTNKNDIWFDGSVFRVYKEGEWIAITLTEEAINRLIQYAKSLDIYVMVTSLPEIGEEKKIYILQTPEGGYSVRLEEYIWENNTWKLVGNFNAVEPILESPFEKGEAEGSAVLKGGNNIAGLKGWYYKAIQFNTNTGNMYLYLTQTQQVPVIVTSVKDVNNLEKTIPFNLPNGTVLSVINDVKYDNQFRLTGNDISKYGRIIVTPLSGEFPFNDIKTDDDLNDNKFDSEDYSVYSTDNPLSGIADMGEFSVAIGLDNKATNNKAVAFGYNNHSYGKFSFTEGRDNKAAYCSHAEGNKTQANGLTSHSEGAGTQANGDISHAEGKGTITTGKCSHAEGRDTQAIGTNSHAEGQLTMAIGNNSHTSGYKTVANNNEESAFGRFNKSNENTRFSIGIGTSEDDRKNAFEVKENGDIYIEGVEGRIQDKLNNPNITSGGVDWNAREGEDGYIANKPFYFRTIETDYVHTGVLEYDYLSSLGISGLNYYFKINIEDIGSVSIYLPNGIPSYNYDKDEQEYYTKTVTFGVNDFTFTVYSNGGGDSVIDILWSHNDCGGSTDPINIEIIECSVDSKKLSEVYIPDTIARKSDLENAGSSSSNEYIITTFTYYGVKNVLNESGYFEHVDNEVLNQIKSNKTIYIKSDSDGGKILCNYTIEGFDTYRLICNDLDLTVESDGTISCSSQSINHNAIITDFTADMIKNAYLDNNSVETHTNFQHAFSSNPIPIIIPKGYDNDGYVHALYVDGYSGYFNLGFIYHDYYYAITVNSDMYQISTIKRAPMPAFE